MALAGFIRRFPPVSLNRFQWARALSTSRRMASPGATIHLTPSPNDQENPPRPPLETQLQNISRNTTGLAIDDETPSDAEWGLLSSHFTGIKDLTLSSGYNEFLNDNIPLQWPLERLVLDSPCGELCRSPWIREAKLKQLRLEFTMGLRFEGPTNDELIKMQKERIARGEEEENKKGGITITILPDLVERWFREKYACEKPEEKEMEEPGDLSSNIETLEIIENDVHDVLARMCVSIPRVFSNLKTLHLRATNGCDFYYVENVLHQLLPQLLSLKTLTLTLGAEYSDPKHMTELYRRLPPNLETLRFRSTAQLAKSEAWPDWVRSFQDPGFLPQLQRLSFLLDLDQTEGTILYFMRKAQREKEKETSEPTGSSVQQDQDRNPTEEKYKVSTEDLRIAKRACAQIWQAAEERGIAVEAFSEDFPAGSPHQKAFDERWEGL